MTEGLWQRPAVDLRAMLASRSISARELTLASIERIKSTNPGVNAVVATNFEQALEAAEQADAATAAGRPTGPLHGLPVLIKDLADTAGLRTTYGSLCFEHHVPDTDATSVAALRRNGAIVLGKTNTPEFGTGGNTTNGVYGATRNPYDHDLTAGGSSGGSAVAVACGMSPLATGSDLGGSLRIPASFCGVVGMRPSAGLVPRSSGVDGFSPLWTDGPMARTVGDVALLLQSMAFFDPLDPLSSPGCGDAGDEGPDVDLTSISAAVSVDLGMAAIDAGIAKAFGDRMTSLGPMFANMVPAKVDLSAGAQVFRVLRAESLACSYAALAVNSRHLMGSNIVANLAEAATFSLADTAAARADHIRIYREFQAVFEDIDVLICPATAVTPFPVEHDHPRAVNGEAMDGYFAWYAVTWALSLTGSPVVTIPCGLDHRGMPIGIQLVGPRFSDRRLLSIAAAVERTLADLRIWDAAATPALSAIG